MTTFSIDDLLKAIRTDTTERAPECVCGAAVKYYRDTCPDCQASQRMADRRLQLGAAYRSLPDMPWAVWGGDWTSTCHYRLIDALGHWERAKGSLVLAGPSGCGKTTAAVARVRSMLRGVEKQAEPEKFRFAVGIRFATAADLATARRQHPLGQGEPWEIVEAIDASLLVLDELGFEPMADTAIPEIADCRYRKGKLTITTTGLKPAELVARYGEATVRKLTGQGRVLDCFEELGK